MNAPSDVTNRLKALIHCGKKELNMEDEEYRIALFSITGKSSTKDMTVREMNRVLDTFKAHGFQITVKAKPNPKVVPISNEVKLPTRKPRDNDPRLKKVWKLWYLLGEHGKCNPSAKSLNAFIKRQTGIENMDWVKTSEQFASVIEALKSFCKREGVNLNG